MQSLFTNLGGFITEIAGDLNVTNNRIVKVALVSMMRSSASVADEEGLKQVEKLAAADVDKLLLAVQ